MLKLTPSEVKVMLLLSSGKLYKEIAADLGISINTVKKHLGHSYIKLKAKSRKEAVEIFTRTNAERA